jgi:hypothetical protein
MKAARIIPKWRRICSTLLGLALWPASKPQAGQRMSSPRLFVVAVGELVLEIDKAPLEVGRTAADRLLYEIVGPTLELQCLDPLLFGHWFGHP